MESNTSLAKEMVRFCKDYFESHTRSIQSMAYEVYYDTNDFNLKESMKECEIAREELWVEVVMHQAFFKYLDLELHCLALGETINIERLAIVLENVDINCVNSPIISFLLDKGLYTKYNKKDCNYKDLVEIIINLHLPDEYFLRNPNDKKSDKKYCDLAYYASFCWS